MMPIWNEELEVRVQERTAALTLALAALNEKNAEGRRTEAGLLLLLEQTEQMLVSIPSIIIGLDKSGIVIAWNTMSERTFGRAKSQTLDQSLDALGLPWDWPRVAAAIEKCRRDGTTIRVDDLAYVDGQGCEAFLGITINAILPYNQEAMGQLLIAADVTERRKAETQLAHRQKLESIGRLAAGVAHEINTPIQYIGDNTRFLQQCFDGFAPVWDVFERLVEAGEASTVPPVIVREARNIMQQADLEYLRAETPQAIAQSLEGIERVTQIVKAMKEFSYPDGESKTPLDLNRALNSTLTVARNEWKYVAEIETDFDLLLPPVLCLPSDLNQVFLNIIVNAAHAISDVVGDGATQKGLIRVSTRVQGGYAEVCIQDTGAGIPEAIRAKIFDPFFTTKAVGRGTGQGLSICHIVIVEKHAGFIQVDSQVGVGTTFTIRLPL